MGARFGTAGIPRDYRGKTPGVMSYLASRGLYAFEYEAVRGVRISDDEATLLGEEARKYGIKLSMHAPYYVNLGSNDDKIWRESLSRVSQAMRALEIAKGTIVVVHPGYYGESPEDALRNVIKAISSLEGKWHVKIGIETMGRLSQIGSLEEVVAISLSFPSFVVPVIDWAHLEARSLGHMRTKDDAIAVLNYLDERLDEQDISTLHCHFSKMEFSRSGEVRHHDLEEQGFYPDFQPVAEAFVELGISDPTFISETSSSERDAITMKRIFEALGGITQIRWRQEALELCQSKCQGDLPCLSKCRKSC
ncbi:MAG: TIM barrel protein [Thermoprotei archaeon]